MKRALLVGIDDYDNFNNLTGCVNDIHALAPLLSRNYDNSPNFDCRSLTSDGGRVDRNTFLEAVDALLVPGADVGLFYFAGHGNAVTNDVTLVTQDGTKTEAGVSLASILGKVQNSTIREIIIVLDCCFSGAAGSVPQLGSRDAVMRQGVAIITASRSDQTASEMLGGRGFFSFYFCGALDGGAADTLGKVNLAGVYAYLSESFGPWEQRPTFKANMDRLHELRRCKPDVPIDELRHLPEFFTAPGDDLRLDPTYEPKADPKHPEHEAIFAILQRCRAAKLVEPVGVEHMYFAAMESKACRLTPLGKHYWRLAEQKRL